MSSHLKNPEVRERRRAERARVVEQSGRCELYLYLENRSVDVARVRDVSPFGICVLLRQPITDDAYVRLTYSNGERCAMVDGTIVWRRRARGIDQQGATALCYWVGIFLHPWRIDANLDFYHAIFGRYPRRKTNSPASR